jgi:alpha-1,3-rhamnosyl/mannosyltransferase
VRDSHGLPERYILYLGSNKPHKNLVRLVEAWAVLQPQPLPLVVAGFWDARYPGPRQHAEELGIEEVIWLGPVPEQDLPALYTGATLFVFPSLYEGFGLPVLEAMACGTPVACSDSSSLPEVAGDAAILFDSTDVGDMAEAIGLLLGNPDLRQRLAKAGLQRAKRFSWQRTAKETLEVYRHVLDSTR